MSRKYAYCSSGEVILVMKKLILFRAPCISKFSKICSASKYIIIKINLFKFTFQNV